MTRAMQLTALLALFAAVALPAQAATPAQQGKPGPRIVCWKDKSGKTLGCGDSVPPEYQDNASTVLNKQGVAVKQSDAALTPEQRKAQADAAAQQETERRAQEDQRRKDKALLETFTTTGEIEDKRARDAALLQSNVETLKANLKNSSDRQADVQARMDEYQKNGKPVPGPLQEEVERVNAQKAKTERQIAAKKQELQDLNEHYAYLIKRFVELGGTDTLGKPAPLSSPAPAPRQP